MPDQHILLLIYFVAFFLLAFVIRSVLVYRNTGINPLVLPRTQDAYGYVGMAFKVLMLGCAGVVSLLAFIPNTSTWLGAITPLELSSIKGLGWICLLLSLLWMLIAQAQMGASWRIGIVIQVQVRLEEKHLSSLHGSAYDQYFSKVPRWL